MNHLRAAMILLVVLPAVAGCVLSPPQREPLRSGPEVGSTANYAAALPVLLLLFPRTLLVA